MKNTGKPSEQLFEEYWARKGKSAFLNRLVDAAEVYGRVGRRGFTRSQPADYIITTEGWTFYAEVKSTTDSKVFKPGLMKKDQRSFATRITAAGGQYWIYVHSLAHNRWFCIPFSKFPQRNTTWTDLEEFHYALL